MIGTVLGNRYELLEKIGEGGMAVVYKSRCNILNRFVAVKILKPEYSNNEEFMEKFKREALATATFSHNNIVGIYDVGRQDNINYIVMEYVKGKTLKEYIKENAPLSTGTTLKISIQIAKALECAHKNKIIHRDIKPHNILITEDEVVKVTDFGIAKATSSETITHTTKIMGSAHYLSPEQAKGKIVDNRTDIYSFGIVMYEMVTGKVPFDGETAVAVALKHIQDPIIPPKSLVPSIPEGLNNVILKATQKEVAKRYNNVTAMLVDLMGIQMDPLYSVSPSNIDSEYTTVMDATQIQNTINAARGMKKDFRNSDEEHDDDDFDDDFDEDDDEDDNYLGNRRGGRKKGPEKWKKTLIILGAVVIVVTLGILTGIAVFNSGNKGKDKVDNTITKIPSIMGLSEAEAKTKLEESGLKFALLPSEESEKEEGTVIRVWPEEGKEVKKESEVKVTLSAGLAEIEVPDVTGLGKTVAQNTLVARGLKIGEITEEYSDDYEVGAVVKTNPAASTRVKKGSIVNIVVSKGSKVKYTRVPDLNGYLIDDASKILETSNLKLGSTTAVITSDINLDGKIFNQSLDEGSKQQYGAEVNVNYYKYKDPDEGKVEVGTYIGLTKEEAQSKIEALGLKVQFTGDDSGHVKEQYPIEGTKVEPGTTIVLNIEAEKDNTGTGQDEPTPGEGTAP